MGELLVITRPDRSLGFRLAGFDCKEVAPREDISTILATIQQEGTYSLVCIEERLLEDVSREVMRRIKKRGLPVIIPLDIPDSWEEKEVLESPITRLIRRAIGYQIKIKR